MTYMTVALDRSVLPAPYILGDRVADRCLKETVPLRRSFRSPCPLHSQGQGRRLQPQRDSPPETTCQRNKERKKRKKDRKKGKK